MPVAMRAAARSRAPSVARTSRTAAPPAPSWPAPTMLRATVAPGGDERRQARLLAVNAAAVDVRFSTPAAREPRKAGRRTGATSGPELAVLPGVNARNTLK